MTFMYTLSRSAMAIIEGNISEHVHNAMKYGEPITIRPRDKSRKWPDCLWVVLCPLLQCFSKSLQYLNQMI
jgi:hypothetical protein